MNQPSCTRNFLTNAVNLAHFFWSQSLKNGSLVIDATCGNGKDTLVLLRHILPDGRLYAIDIQEEALQRARFNIEQEFSSHDLKNLRLIHGCHRAFPSDIALESVDLIVYNLGYLPGSDKSCITQTESTLHSLNHAQHFIKIGGIISIVCYPGHDGGFEETSAVLEWSKQLSAKSWVVSHHTWNNRHRAPSLLYLVRIK